MFYLRTITGLCLLTLLTTGQMCATESPDTEDPQDDSQTTDTEFELEVDDDSSYYVARAGKRTDIPFTTWLGCGSGDIYSGTSTGSGDFQEIVSLSNLDDDEPPRIDFVVSATKGVEGQAQSNCVLESDPFVVRPADGGDQKSFNGDVILDATGHFTTTDANNYQIKVWLEISDVGTAGDTLQETQSHSFCYNVLTVDSYSQELCNNPPSPVHTFIIRVSGVSLGVDSVYNAYVGLAATIGSANEVTGAGGGQVIGYLEINELYVCVESEACAPVITP